MAVKSRTTIAIPSDVQKEITKIQRRMPHLSRNEVLLMLARRGIAESVVDDVSGLVQEVRSSLSDANGAQAGQSYPDEYRQLLSEVNRSKELSMHSLILLRRFINESLGEKGTAIIEQSKADVSGLRKRQNEQ